MSRGLMGCLIAGGAVLLMALIMGGCVVGIYNRVVTQNESIDSTWAQVENVLQRRGDLIPNLVQTVKGYAAHEKEIFTNVAEARGRLAGAVSPREAAAANAGLSSALGRLLAIAEAYPDLKANQNFMRLQDELAGSENRIAVERRRYNEAVRAYNTSIKRFPARFIAGFFNFGEREYFEAEEAKKELPEVEF
ncbi:MAG: LemA family protein [Acidobacteriota bacterium]